MHQQIVDQMLYPAWQGIPADYKAKYARNIWDQFEERIKSAAYTSNIHRCFSDLCLSLRISVRSDDTRQVAEFLAVADQRAVLRLLRDETTTLVLMCRLRNQERKEAYEQERMLNEELNRPFRKDEPLLYTDQELGSLFGGVE